MINRIEHSCSCIVECIKIIAKNDKIPILSGCLDLPGRLKLPERPKNNRELKYAVKFMLSYILSCLGLKVFLCLLPI